MERIEFEKVVNAAVRESACSLVEITIDKEGADVDLKDCEFVHRAVLAAFDRNIEDYSLTVTSPGISGEEADEMLKKIKD